MMLKLFASTKLSWFDPLYSPTYTFDLYDITSQYLGKGRRYLKRTIRSGIYPHDFNPSPRRALTAYGSVLDEDEGTQAAGN
jgi:hypothetical protein